MFYFDYGCLAFWGLTEAQEREVLAVLVRPALVDALPHSEVEVDEFQVQWGSRVGGWVGRGKQSGWVQRLEAACH